MEHGDYDGCFVGFEDEFADSHFEEPHWEVWGLVYPSFGKDVDPAVVWLIEESNSMVHRRLIDASRSEWGMTIDGEGVSEGEEQI
jgi:hypothetical protein